LQEKVNFGPEVSEINQTQALSSRIHHKNTLSQQAQPHMAVPSAIQILSPSSEKVNFDPNANKKTPNTTTASTAP